MDHIGISSVKITIQHLFIFKFALVFRYKYIYECGINDPTQFAPVYQCEPKMC